MSKFIDLTGQRFGKWTVVCRAKNKGEGRNLRTRWYCRCDCGNEKSIRQEALRGGSSQSCGCRVRIQSDEAGNYYGRWSVIKRVEDGAHRETRYLCLCTCNEERVVRLSELRNGNSKSCGCIQQLPPAEAARRQILVGYKRSAKNRRLGWNLDDKLFKLLLSDFCHYCGAPPLQVRKSGGSTCVYNGIDRIDNTKGYVPGNVVTCCKTCNTAKMTMTQQEFYDWVTRVFNQMTTNASPLFGRESTPGFGASKETERTSLVC